MHFVGCLRICQGFQVSVVKVVAVQFKVDDHSFLFFHIRKCFGLQKGPLGQDRLCTWSEAAKHGRMFVCFIGLILASYVRSVHKQNEYLRTKFASIEDILAEMRSIRCIEHEGRLKFIATVRGCPSGYLQGLRLRHPGRMRSHLHLHVSQEVAQAPV